MKQYDVIVSISSKKSRFAMKWLTTHSTPTDMAATQFLPTMSVGDHHPHFAINYVLLKCWKFERLLRHDVGCGEKSRVQESLRSMSLCVSNCCCFRTELIKRQHLRRLSTAENNLSITALLQPQTQNQCVGTQKWFNSQVQVNFLQVELGIATTLHHDRSSSIRCHGCSPASQWT